MLLMGNLCGHQPPVLFEKFLFNRFFPLLFNSDQLADKEAGKLLQKDRPVDEAALLRQVVPRNLSFPRIF